MKLQHLDSTGRAIPRKSSGTSAAKMTRKTQKSTLVNKEAEAATNDKRVHSSRSENTAVGECGKRTKTTHATTEFRLACRPCGCF